MVPHSNLGRVTHDSSLGLFYLSQSLGASMEFQAHVWQAPTLSPDIFSAISLSSSAESFLVWKWDFWELFELLWLCTWDRVCESARNRPDIFPLVQKWAWITDTLSSSFFFTFRLWVALWSALLAFFLRKVIQETASSFCNIIWINKAQAFQ